MAHKICLRFLDKDKLCPILKVITFLHQYNILEDQNCDVLETFIVKNMLQSNDNYEIAAYWQVIVCYITGFKDLEVMKSSCRRIVRKLCCQNDTDNERINNSHNIAVKLLCKFEISDEDEFNCLFPSLTEKILEYDLYGSNEISSDTIIENTNENGCLYFELPYTNIKSNIIWVDCSDLEIIKFASTILLTYDDDDEIGGENNNDNLSKHCTNSQTLGNDGDADDDQQRPNHNMFKNMKKVVGIDVEWRPYSTGSMPSPCSILQIACNTHCFIFDLLQLETNNKDTNKGTNSFDKEFTSSDNEIIDMETKTTTEASLEYENETVNKVSLCQKAYSKLISNIWQDSNILKAGMGIQYALFIY